MVNTREIVLDCIIEILEKKQYSHQVIKQALDKYGYLDKRDRSFIKRVTEGTIERCMELDHVLNLYSKVPVSKMKPVIRSILRIGVYQLLYMDGVPDSAVCNESVKLAAKRGFAGLKGFVNGVLRSVAKQKGKIPYPAREENAKSYLSLTYSMPEWIVERWLASYGEAQTEEILAGLLAERPLTIRIKESLSPAAKQELLEEMNRIGIGAEQIKELPYAYWITGADRVEAIPGFMEGKCFVQDAGSMAILEAAEIKEGQSIIDVCAAPGGKALHGAEKLKGTGMVTARDVSEYKVLLMKENIKRSGLTNIRAQVQDALMLREEDVEKADLVIADLPCSGLGVIGRKGDIKYRIGPEDIEKITKLQRKILSVVWQYVRPGGKLLYSTCTLTEEENHQNAVWLCENFPFQLIKERTLLPGKEGTDGFYLAVLAKKK